MSDDNWVTEEFERPQRHPHPLDVWVCLTCGAMVDYGALPLHRKWHGNAPGPIKNARDDYPVLAQWTRSDVASQQMIDQVTAALDEIDKLRRYLSIDRWTDAGVASGRLPRWHPDEPCPVCKTNSPIGALMDQTIEDD